MWERFECWLFGHQISESWIDHPHAYLRVQWCHRCGRVQFYDHPADATTVD